MGFSIHWSWLAALLCAFWMGAGVRCACPESNLQMQGGNYTLSNNLERGSMLVYHCPEGYYPYPAITRLCQANNSWRPRPKRFPAQRCRLIECPDPNVLEYGNVSPPQEKYYVDNETTYECYSGYTMRGSATRVCLKNGKWSGSTPICSRDSGDHCANPGIPPGASRVGNMFGIDDTVRYTCNGNLFLVGSSERVCQENSQWSGNEPACYCKNDTNTYSDSIFCHSDDIQGERKIRISKNGTLNIYIGVDISDSISEDYVNKSRDAVVKLITTISSFTVTPNYEITFFSSELYEIVNIIDFMDGTAKLSDVKTKLEEFAVGDRNTGTNLNLVFEQFLEKMALIKIRAGEENFKEHRHVIIVFTDGISSLLINSAINNKKCSSNFMLSQYGFFGFYNVLKYRFFKGLCGLHKEYEDHRNELKRKMYPWMAFISTQADGHSKKCMGSLVTPEFVLTAAHCVYGFLPEKVTVEIDDGQHKIKKAKTLFYHPKYNVTAKKDKGINEFYDYDVALIQLEKYVDISTKVRPICIPCTLETNAALHLVDQSCQSQGVKTLTSNVVDLKDVHAKLGDNRYECIKHAVGVEGITADTLRDAVTDNFICTGGLQPFRDHIACTGDSGGAVYKNFEHRTIQVALVSWGSQQVCRDGGVKESKSNSRDFHINLFKVVDFLKAVLGKQDMDYAPLEFLEN
uniref:C3/C5 convertase n=1 Tax=Oreochromis niloticus TaxID=8128 RepID=A0A669EIE7_ORENI